VKAEDVNGDAMITRERHRFHVQACLDALRRFLARPGQVSFGRICTSSNLDVVMVTQVDMAAEELRVAAHSLGVVTGRVDVEELLDIVFRDFCIGK
jgi:tRNA modification GTPase